MTNDYGNLELHTVLLSAMKDFDAVCRKYGLHYTLHGGTCLGAIRHKGFIPWDDDVDIAMLRKDYEQFRKIAPKEFGEKYTVQTYQNCRDMSTNVMKIRINRSGFIGNDEQDEAFLDIFPMSDVPNSKFLQKIQNRLIIFLNQIVYTKYGQIIPTSLKSKIVLGTLSKLPRMFWGNLIEFFIVHFPHYHSEFVNIVSTANYNGYGQANYTGYAWDLLPKGFMTEIEQTEFEGEQFYITKHWDEYLSTRYGDYMMPPPEEKRVNKHNMTKTKNSEAGR